MKRDDSAAWARERGDFVWIGFHEPTEQDLEKGAPSTRGGAEEQGRKRGLWSRLGRS